jgi:hypothetical protein
LPPIVAKQRAPMGVAQPFRAVNWIISQLPAFDTFFNSVGRSSSAVTRMSTRPSLIHVAKAARDAPRPLSLATHL